MSVEHPEEKCDQTECNFSVDQPVQCMLNRQKKYGTIRFIGNTEFSSGAWYGIELNEANGKNDGSVAGVRYFDCKPHHGIFVSLKHIFPVEDDCEDKRNSMVKTVKKRVLPNVKETPARFSDVANKTLPEVSFDEIIETRPRSKSDNCFPNEHPLNVLNDSPFKCDFTGKSSSHPKLNNATYICHTPFYKEDDKDISGPKCSSPLAICPDNCNVTEKVPNEEASQVLLKEEAANEKHSVPSPINHVQLSPQLEVKQSIKLGCLTTSKIPAPFGKRLEYNLNKTFLIHQHSPNIPKEAVNDNMANINGRKPRSVNDGCKENKDNEVITNEPLVNDKCTVFSIDENEPDEVRSRSVSKSSWSSMESLSSVGSNKTEKTRLKGTNRLKESTGKTPLLSNISKSKLVKTSGENKVKARLASKESSSSTKKQSGVNCGVTATTASDNISKVKSRTKSSSIVSAGFKSVFDTPANKNTISKTKSKSVSSHEDAVKTSLTSSKLSTPASVSSRNSGSAPPRRLASTSRATPSVTKKPSEPARKALDTPSKKPALRSSTVANSRTNLQRSLPQESNNAENRNSIKQAKVPKSSKQQVKPEENKTSVIRTRIMSTPAATSDTKSAVSKSSAIKSTPRVARPSSGNSLRKIPETPIERTVLKKKTASVDSTKKKDGSIQKRMTDNKDDLMKKKDEKNIENNKYEKVPNCLSSALTPDILKQTPEVTRHSVAIQVDIDNLELEKLQELYKKEQSKVKSSALMLTQRNRDFTAALVSLQVYSQKLDIGSKNVLHLKKCVDFNKEKFFNAEKAIAKETSHRFRLEDEMLSIKSDSVVELALLRAECERKQELMQNKLLDDHKRSLEKVRKRNVEAMDELKQSCDLKLKRVEETYVQDISDLNEKHKDEIAELETQHSKVIEELIEEREAEIEIIKADYDELLLQLNERLSESSAKCSKLSEKLKTVEEESKRDIESRIQEAIAKYKTLPDELESMEFVLEMKHGEIKKLRQNVAECQETIEKLERAKNRAALLEREKESLNFVVEHKVQFERQLSLERDKLRLSLDREVAASKRLSLENEELAWRLNTYQNSPTSPSFDRHSWRMSGFNSPDSAIFSQRIEESDIESHIDDTKGSSS